jgi:hypothetical protein
MPQAEIRARVFVSCGQQDEEMGIVDKIENLLREKHFEPYVARKQRSLKSLRENIFRELDDSEYFLFIDFKRESIGNLWQRLWRKCEKRGSLFTNQELAIAAFLDLDPIAFQQRGVKKLDGMMQALQLNCEEFENEANLLDKIEAWLESGAWNPDWKRRLLMSRAPMERGGTPDDQPYLFHIEVRNLHRRREARQCRAYLDEVVNQDTGKPVAFEMFQLKWAGTLVPDANIRPKKSWSFDAFYVEKDDPVKLRWKGFSFADTDKVCPDVVGAGKYLMRFVVTSQNFPEVRSEFILDLQQELSKTSFTIVA